MTGKTEEWCEWCAYAETCMGDKCKYFKRADVEGKTRYQDELISNELLDIWEVGDEEGA